MNRARVNAVTVGVFSWALLEPAEGKFEFGWLDDTLDRLHAGAGLAHRGGDGADVAARLRGVGAAAGLSGPAGSGRGRGTAAAGGGVRGRDRAGHGEGEGGGPAVEAEAAGRAGLAGRGARRPVHPGRSRRGNSGTRTVKGSSFFRSGLASTSEPG